MHFIEYITPAETRNFCLYFENRFFVNGTNTKRQFSILLGTPVGLVLQVHCKAAKLRVVAEIFQLRKTKLLIEVFTARSTYVHSAVLLPECRRSVRPFFCL